MITIAFDLGGTKIKMGIVQSGKLLDWTSVKANSDRGLVQGLPSLEKEMNALLDKNNLGRKDIDGVGIASPGLVNTDEMKVISINEKYADIIDFDLTEWAHTTWGAPLFLENDARAALAGEWQAGAGKGCDNIVGLTLGTGLGTSAVMQGNLVRGKHFQAGILGGHFIVNVNGTQCNCGNIGCAEAEASTWNLKNLASKEPIWKCSPLSEMDVVDYKAVFDLADSGDKLSLQVRQHGLDIWSSTVINMIHAYDPEMVVLNGGIMARSDVIIPYLQQKVDSQAWLGWGKVKIVKAENLNTAALLGVAYLATTLNENRWIK